MIYYIAKYQQQKLMVFTVTRSEEIDLRQSVGNDNKRKKSVET